MTDPAENGLEEEIEVLEAIYIHELEVERDEGNQVKRISLLLHPSTGDDLDQKFVCMTLILDINQQYPEMAPEISIRNPRGIGEEEVQGLIEDMMALGQDRQGCPMLYELIELAKESLTEGNIPHCLCMICLEHFHEAECFTKTPCYHYFHGVCLARYVKHCMAEPVEVNSLSAIHMKAEEKKLVCPVCREPLDYKLDELPETPVEEKIPFRPSAELQKMQRDMADILERQRALGGIIDIEAEKNKFLLKENDVVHLSLPVQAAGQSDEDRPSSSGQRNKDEEKLLDRRRERNKRGTGERNNRGASGRSDGNGNNNRGGTANRNERRQRDGGTRGNGAQGRPDSGLRREKFSEKERRTRREERHEGQQDKKDSFRKTDSNVVREKEERTSGGKSEGSGGTDGSAVTKNSNDIDTDESLKLKNSFSRVGEDADKEGVLGSKAANIDGCESKGQTKDETGKTAKGFDGEGDRKSSHVRSGFGRPPNKHSPRDGYRNDIYKDRRYDGDQGGRPRKEFGNKKSPRYSKYDECQNSERQTERSEGKPNCDSLNTESRTYNDHRKGGFGKPPGRDKQNKEEEKTGNNALPADSQRSAPSRRGFGKPPNRNNGRGGYEHRDETGGRGSKITDNTERSEGKPTCDSLNNDRKTCNEHRKGGFGKPPGREKQNREESIGNNSDNQTESHQSVQAREGFGKPPNRNNARRGDGNRDEGGGRDMETTDSMDRERRNNRQHSGRNAYRHASDRNVDGRQTKVEVADESIKLHVSADSSAVDHKNTCNSERVYKADNSREDKWRGQRNVQGNWRERGRGRGRSWHKKGQGDYSHSNSTPNNVEAASERECVNLSRSDVNSVSDKIAEVTICDNLEGVKDKDDNFPKVKPPPGFGTGPKEKVNPPPGF